MNSANRRTCFVNVDVFFVCISVNLACKSNVYLTIMYVYCAYPAISSSPKQLPNCLKIVETSVVLIVFNGVIFDVSAYNITVSFCRSTWITYQKLFICIYSLKMKRWIYWRNMVFVQVVVLYIGICWKPEELSPLLYIKLPLLRSRYLKGE